VLALAQPCPGLILVRHRACSVSWHDHQAALPLAAKRRLGIFLPAAAVGCVEAGLLKIWLCSVQTFWLHHSRCETQDRAGQVFPS
jgi:hypothetical protein